MTDAVQQPDAQAQLDFLQKLQLLFNEGSFVSTYKYALLLTLTELSIEQGDDSGGPLSLALTDIADRFADLYWLQSAPYAPDPREEHRGLLSQNLGAQTVIIQRLAALRSAGADTLIKARKHSDWPKVQRDIARTVREMPIRYLQNFSGDTVEFLYSSPMERGGVTLLPGVAFNLRRFQGFIQRLARSGWVDHVRSNSRNLPLVGSVADLETFMFGTQRAQLSDAAKVLRPIQDGRCFYCLGRLNERPAVDHFIPWSRYPRDTALNFVLTHSDCNLQKREFLAGRPHLDRWLERNAQRGVAIGEQLQKLGFLAEPEVTTMVARWAYHQARDSGAKVWLTKNHLVPILDSCIDAF